MKYSLVIYITSILALTVLLTPLSVLSETPISCSAWIRCSTIPDNTYGFIGKACHIYRNPCFITLENCDRKVRNETLIIPSTKKKCKPFCPSVCPLYVLPFCAEYLNHKKTFNNECEMERYNCKNDKTFRLFSQGACKCPANGNDKSAN
ncbi:U-Kazal-Dg21.2-like [Episyrphus balteatus]|uniref:U-Kazal-Dg21.2-like n=1 Tax=Episyrphus balteatus TaxID=286459 RepID=UPI0024867A97|nr:U-Kazal-Dg21.2-like [Episyrphus balteatus]